jgi:hypothetical protein
MNAMHFFFNFFGCNVHLCDATLTQTAAEVAAVLGIDRIGIDHGLCEVLHKRNVSKPPTYLTPDQLASDPSLAGRS